MPCHKCPSRSTLRQPWYWAQDFVPLTGEACSEAADLGVAPYQLCATCIPTQGHVRTVEIESTGDTTPTVTLAHASIGLALEDSAAGGCHLCTLLWQLTIRDAYQSQRYADTVPRHAGWMGYAAQIRSRAEHCPHA